MSVTLYCRVKFSRNCALSLVNISWPGISILMRRISVFNTEISVVFFQYIYIPDSRMFVITPSTKRIPFS